MENKKYDLEKAKEDCRRHEDALEEAQSCMCGHCHECGFDPSEMKAALDEVERLRSQSVEQVFRKKNEELAAKDAYIKRLEAAFLGATKEIVYATHEGRDAPEGEDVYAEKEAREALERIKNGND